MRFLACLACLWWWVVIQSPDLESLLQRARTLAELERDAYRRSQLLRKIACLQAKIGAVEAAIATVKASPIMSARILALASVASARADMGDSRGGRALLDNAEQLVEFNDRDFMTANARVVFAIAFARCGDFDRADALIENESEELNKRFACEDLANLMAANTHIERALAILRKLPSTERDWSYLSVGRERIRAKDVKCALRIAQEMLDASLQGEILAGIAELQATQGRVEAALSTADTVKGNIRRANSLFVIARALVLRKDCARAEGVLSLAMREEDKLTDPDERVMFLSFLVDVWSLVGRRDKVEIIAALLLKELERGRGSSRWKHWARASVVTAMTRVGCDEESARLLKCIEQGYALDYARGQLAWCLEEMNKPDQALKTAASIEDPLSRAECFVVLSRLSNTQKDTVRALNTLRLAFQIVAPIAPGGFHADEGSPLMRKAQVMDEIIDLFTSMGDVAMALQGVRLIEKDFKSVRAGTTEVQRIAMRHAETVPFDKVWQWVQAESDGVVRAHAIVGMVEGILNRRKEPK